ncbi:MAG: metal transporter [Allorhizobium sp.]|jgi:zinc transporter ZupT|nr:MAG: metal transporter [Rhodobacteraceae bacterium GWE1_64_9]OHC47473.1 MAG: metal transporter [Rhodobacteraceae bacterium GWF1_65_7]HBD90539.1 metal transporter [Gemmobacter sp.]HBU16353.1 metal transporter [Gemmobacter sp.]
MSDQSQPTRPTAIRLLLVLLPLAAILGSFVWIASLDPLRSFNNGAPPVESLTVERTVLDQTGIQILVRAGGSEAMQIAQVAVDDAYWTFTQNPPGPIARGSAVWVQIPYPWVLGEAHHVALVSNTGTVFGHEIAVAVQTPKATAGQFRMQALVGALVGLLPVALGLMFYPAMRGFGTTGMNFVLALTVGMLAFLLLDMLGEATELAAEAAAMFQGSAMVWLSALASFLLLMAIGRWRGRPEGLALAFYIALGIGLHNFGEGLAIGGAFAAGAAGLGTFLVLGFALHNVTEGIGIAAPMLRIRPPLWSFAALTLLAGGPAVLGIWVGSLAYAPQWSALALAVGAGAILQVMVEVTAYLQRQNIDRQAIMFSPAVLGGFLGGIAFMYVTAALIKV